MIDFSLAEILTGLDLSEVELPVVPLPKDIKPEVGLEHGDNKEAKPKSE